MESIELRQKLHHYIENAEEKKLLAIFTMIEDEVNEYYTHWDNEDFLNKLNERELSYLNGTAKTYTASKSGSRAREAIKQLSK